jgi:hypothetical protein
MTKLRRGERMRSFFVMSLICLSACGWNGADEFQQQLRCGMSPDEVKAIASKHGATDFRAVASAPLVTHVVSHNRTFFWLRFGDSGLDFVRRGRQTGLTGSEMQPAVNLCTGEKQGSLLLTIRGTAAMTDAHVVIDSRDVGRLSGGPDYRADVYVSSGQHEIALVKDARTVTKVTKSYPPDLVADTLDFRR